MEPIRLPAFADLESWIAAREAQVPGLKPGVAAGVVWADPAHPRPTSFSLVYLHGYTASRGEMAPVPERIAAALGANVFYARLTGHGGDPDGHRTCTAADWERDALEAFQIGALLGERVIVLGTSTGGTLAAWLTLGPPAVRPTAVVLVSPNLTVKNRATELLLGPGKEWVLKALMGESLSFPPANELNQRYWDCVHHSHSLIPMMDLVNRTRRLDFGLWPVPALVVFNPADPVVDARATRRLFSRAPGELVTTEVWTPAPGDHPHVLAGDALSPQGTDRLVELSLGFLRTAVR